VKSYAHCAVSNNDTAIDLEWLQSPQITYISRFVSSFVSLEWLDNNVETDWTCSVCFDFVDRTKFRLTLLPKGKKRQQCRSNVRLCWINSRLCRSNIWLCRKNRLSCSIRQCCFDIVARVYGALGYFRYESFVSVNCVCRPLTICEKN